LEGNSVKLRAEIAIRGINPFIPLSAAQAAALQPGWRRPMPVRVRFAAGGIWFRTNAMPAGNGGFYLYLRGAMRVAAGAEVGDRVACEVVFDEAYRTGPAHPTPTGLAALLDADADAKRRWQALAPSRRKEVLRHLAGLKSDAARERNLRQLTRALRGEPVRFMARDWNAAGEPPPRRDG
jgi:hypothetical protein